MLIKKLSRILAISVIAFLAVLLWNTKSSQADESSKLLNSAVIQKIVKKGTLNVGVKQDVPNFGYYSAKTNTYQGMESARRTPWPSRSEAWRASNAWVLRRSLTLSRRRSCASTASCVASSMATMSSSESSWLAERVFTGTPMLRKKET